MDSEDSISSTAYSIEIRNKLISRKSLESAIYANVSIYQVYVEVEKMYSDEVYF